jgi:alkanesulfonate monooxygenase SsuD/methylene tetrahydromethanopterin reductase-like flavin-dependent oxidoreductase (luciferase family)
MRTHAELFDDLTELVRIAEAGGMAAAWIGEHHAMEFTIAPNPFINIAYLANETSRIRLGTGTIVAPFWHPIKLAGEAALTDIATRGRLNLGLARGAYSFEYERLSPGLDAMQAGLRLREMIPALKGLWDGDYAHEGQFWSFPSTSAVPKPVQRPHPPLWVAARDPNSHAFAVANGCNVQVTPLAQGDAEVASLMERFEAACAAAPHRERPKIMLLVHTFVGETQAEVEEAARDLSRFFAYFGAWFKNERPVRQGFIEELSEADIAGYANYAPDVLRRTLVIGTPDEVIERLKGYEALGYDQYSLWIDSLMLHEKKKRSLELFIERVMPAFA